MQTKTDDPSDLSNLHFIRLLVMNDERLTWPQMALYSSQVLNTLDFVVLLCHTIKH